MIKNHSMWDAENESMRVFTDKDLANSSTTLKARRCDGCKYYRTDYGVLWSDECKAWCELLSQWSDGPYLGDGAHPDLPPGGPHMVAEDPIGMVLGVPPDFFCKHWKAKK